MDTRAPYETLMGKSKDAIIRELEQLIGAAKITLTEGGHWLIGQRAPCGPMMRERSVHHLYKSVWGMHAANVDHFYINEILDWLYANAMQPNGDFYFPEEPPDHQISTRVYRTVVFFMVASLVNHRIAKDEKVVRRILQCQDPKTGGCFNHIGEDPSKPELPDFLAIAETSFFGEFALAAGLKEEALKAGAWMLKLVQENIPHMANEGVFYCLTDRAGQLIRRVNPGEKFVKTVNNIDGNQAGWNVGCAMALLADLYDTVRERWGYGADGAQAYIDAALALLDFENTMPLYTYFYLSKCKVVWGAGVLLKVLLKYRLASEEQLEELYRISKRVFVYTFLGTQLPDGSWPPMHYPLGDDSPELQLDYRVLKGLTLNPAEKIKERATSSFLPAVEITGEFLGEIGAMVSGLLPLLEYYRNK